MAFDLGMILNVGRVYQNAPHFGLCSGGTLCKIHLRHAEHAWRMLGDTSAGGGHEMALFAIAIQSLRKKGAVVLKPYAQ